jgi:hypothetical protein
VRGTAALLALFLQAGARNLAAQDVPAKLRADEPAGGEGGVERYVVPALEVVGFDVLLNLYDRHYDHEREVYRSDLDTIERNLRRNWIIDGDPFAVNQFMHPYHGSLVHGFARSAGLGYWTSLAYDVGGSALWEIAGETGAPSYNDQITTSFGGSFLGEALFRMAGLLLEGGGPDPGFLRGAGAALISPPVGFNRVAFGDRFDGVFPGRGPATFLRAGVGGRWTARVRDLGIEADVPGGGAVAEVSMDYGLPGKPGYAYTRPFDYFQLDAAASSSSPLPEHVLVRGLLLGSDYAWGESFRGIAGLYGTFDYAAPEIFSVSSTALALGTTVQGWLSKDVALQGTILGGGGWTAVGSITDATEDRDFHYGVSPQGLLAVRLLFGDVAMLDLTGREYYVGKFGDRETASKENILRGQASLTFRVYGRHALGVGYVSTVRNSNFLDLADGLEVLGTLTLFYTYLSDERFGAVEWRP